MTKTLNFFHFKKELVNRKDFNADNIDLDKYIKDQMSQNEERNLSRNYVGLDDDGRFVSMLCLSTSIIKADDVVEAEASYPPKNELPTIKIGRLVVDKRYRKQRYGEQTLQKAIGIFVEISKKVGSIGLTVDSKKDSTEFYKKYGFKELKSGKGHDYIPLILYTHILKKNRPSLFENPV